MRDDHMYYRRINDRLEIAGNSTETPDQQKLVDYLFLCFAYELKKDRAEAVFQEPVWSDKKTTFSILINHAGGVSHDYCCSCIEAIGGSWNRECGVLTNACFESEAERDEAKNRFFDLLDQAKERLVLLFDRTPQEYFFMETSPVIKKIGSTPNNHYVELHADIHDAVDMLCMDETLQPWADYERIRDYYENSVNEDGEAEVRMVFYRVRKQKKFVRYLNNLGVKEEEKTMT